MAETDPSRRIVVRRRGNRLGFWSFKVTLRLFGLKAAYGLLYAVSSYYLLFDWSAVRASMAYIRRRFRARPLAFRFLAVYRLFVSQGKNLIDRYYMTAGLGRFDIQINGYETIRGLVENPATGFVLLTAHVGNWQVIMSALREFGKPVCLLMRPEDNPAVQEYLRITDPRGKLSVISPEQELGGVVEMLNLIRGGSIVSMMGDRSYGYSALPTRFLGEPARLPYGPFAIAAAAECPVVVLFAAKVGVKNYRVDIVKVIRPRYSRGQPKRAQLGAWVAEFAGALEAYVESFPYQCFLFHDIWADIAPEPPQRREGQAQAAPAHGMPAAPAPLELQTPEARP